MTADAARPNHRLESPGSGQTLRGTDHQEKLMIDTKRSGDETAPRAGIYTRVSTEDQAREGYSLGDQAERCRELVERNGWELVAVYEDAGFSGDDPNRPGYKRMLDDVAAGKLDAVVVIALDRFGRDAWAVEGTLRFFDEHAVRLISTRETIDRRTPEGTLQTGILAQFAQFEKAKIKARTKSGIAARARLGIPWGVPKLGYGKGQDGDWVLVPDEAATVRRAYELRLDGLSYQSVAGALNRTGLRGRGGGKWTATGIRRLLNGRYALGYFLFNDEWIKGRHPAIISEDTWQAAQALAEAGRQNRSASARPGRRPKLHLFTGGLLRCGVCFEPMVPRSDDGDRYVCGTNRRHLTADHCPMPSHRRADVDGRFLALFEEQFLDDDATREHVAKQLGARPPGHRRAATASRLGGRGPGAQGPAHRRRLPG